MSSDAANPAIIFDLDGTLVDSYRAITEALNFARREHDLEALEESTVRAAVGHGLEQLIAEWIGEDRIETGVQAFRQRYAEVFSTLTFALPGVETALEALHQRCTPMAVASNKPARFSKQIIEQLGWSSYFVTVEGPDTVGATKPNPAMLRRCLTLLGRGTDGAIYVGDMELDVESAHRAQLPCLLVATGSAELATLEGTDQLVLPNLSTLMQTLDSRSWRPFTPAAS
jgi:phosphoglycolate phosphatase